MMQPNHVVIGGNSGTSSPALVPAPAPAAMMMGVVPPSPTFISRVSPDPCVQQQQQQQGFVATTTYPYNMNQNTNTASVMTDDQQEQQEELDLEPLPLYVGNDAFTPINCPELSERTFPGLHQQQQQQHHKSVDGGAVGCPSRLEQLWMKMTENASVDDYEPRKIQDMISKPNLWHDACPSMTPEHQAIFELMLPVSMPAIFYYFEMSYLAHMLGVIIIIGHTIECFCTNFGGSAWKYKDVLGPIQHVAIDMLWNQAMLSLFFIFGPSVFGPYSIPICFVVLPGNVMGYAVNMKNHFNVFILKPNVKLPLTDDSPLAKVLKHKMGHHLRRFFTWYMLVAVLLASAFYKGNTMTQVLAVFVLNLSPFVTELSYWFEFSTQLRSLPKEFKTVMPDAHLDYLLRRSRPLQTSSGNISSKKHS